MDFDAYPLDIPDDEIVLIPTPTKNKVLDVDPDAVGVDTVPRMILVEASITDGSPIFASYSGVPSLLNVGDWVILDNDGLDTEPRVTGGVSVPSVTPVAPAWLKQTPFTGIISGGLLSITDAGATYKISAGTGRIVDYSNPAQPPIITEMAWGDITGLTVSPTGEYTSVALDYISSVVTVVTKDDAPWSQSEQRRLVVIGNVVHVGTTITEVTSDPVPVYNFPHGVMDFFNATGGLYNDFVIHTTNANRTFQQDEGTYTSPFVNYANDIMSPSTIQHPAFDPKDFLYSMRDGVGGFMFTVPVNGNEVDPLYWDDGTGTLNSLGNNRWTFQPVYFFGGVAKLILVYGQNEYASRGDAETGIVEDFEELILDPTLNRSRIFGFFLLKKGATDLTDESEAEFISVFQVYSGGGGGGVTSWTQLSDTPATITANQLVSGNAAGDALVFSDPPADGGQYARIDNTFARTRFDGNVDVNVLGVTNGQGVAYNSTTMVWEPVTLSTGGGDIVANLVNTEVAITTTTTLTSTAFGKMHTIAGTTADYTITLPAASGNNGSILGLRVLNTATKVFTIDGSGSETIDGTPNKKIKSGDTLVLLCDGSNWAAIVSKIKSYGFSATMSANQTASTNTDTKVQFNTVVFDDLGDYDAVTNYRYTPSAPGKYQLFVGGGFLNIGDDTRAIVYVYKNGAQLFRDERTSAPVTSRTTPKVVTVTEMNGTTDDLEVYMFQDSGSDQLIRAGADSYFIAIKVE